MQVGGRRGHEGERDTTERKRDDQVGNLKYCRDGWTGREAGGRDGLKIGMERIRHGREREGDRWEGGNNEDMGEEGVGDEGHVVGTDCKNEWLFGRGGRRRVGRKEGQGEQSGEGGN